MISTVRGNDKAFKGATIKPTGTIETNNADNWQDYTEASQAKIKLPAAGKWQISIAPDDKQILFYMLEGEAPAEHVDIITCTQVVTVNGVERDDLSDTFDNDGNRTGREEEGGAGETWDNQFFIVADRVIDAGEETVIEFDYVANKEAKTTTQCHAQPGGYIHWAAIGDVDFTTEVQHFQRDFTIPSECANRNFQSIAFNMAEIKEACDYTIKNVRWYIKSDDNAEGKTPENLINEAGGGNFYVKVGAGTNPVMSIADITIDNITKSDVIYNLSGQRVSKDYKGVVIKNGRKFVQK
jgi:hypothetical protein